MAAPTKWTYSFGGGSAEGSIGMKALLGGKGAGLAEMSRIGLNVPPGITITTELCQEYHRTGSLPESLWSSVVEGIERIEKLTGLTFCPDVATRPGTRPLLVSVRSGAAASMPGMMDTVLNVGLNLEIATDFAAHAERPRHAWDCYRRLISMYGDVVAGVPKATFEAALAAAKQAAGVSADVELDAASLRGLCGAFTSAYAAGTGAPFPTDPWAMLRASIEGVVRSWDNPRAVKYRALNRLTGLRGTAVTVQAMVFGNADARSGSGVLFSRNPSTGERGLWGEVLMDAQGEDVVSGVRTPSPLAALEAALPAAYADLVASVAKLEAHCRDMQDVEFTVQRGELFMLQCRDGKRTGPAALRIAVDMVAEGAVTTEDAVRRLVTPGHLDQVLHPTFVEVAPEAAAKRAAALLARGMAASPGAAVGRAVFSSADAEAWHARGERVILLRPETAAEDVGASRGAGGRSTDAGRGDRKGARGGRGEDHGAMVAA